jgi:hypothetical protein
VPLRPRRWFCAPFLAFRGLLEPEDKSIDSLNRDGYRPASRAAGRFSGGFGFGQTIFDIVDLERETQAAASWRQSLMVTAIDADRMRSLEDTTMAMAIGGRPPIVMVLGTRQ